MKPSYKPNWECDYCHNTAILVRITPGTKHKIIMFYCNEHGKSRHKDSITIDEFHVKKVMEE